MVEEESAEGRSDRLIDEVAEWLMSCALGETGIEALVGGCCTRLQASGIPLSRAYVAFRTLHPLFAGVGLTWTRSEGVRTFGYRHGDIEGTEDWEQSPFAHLLATGTPFLRRHLVGPDALIDFPALAVFRDQGATDYLAYAIPFANGTQAGSGQSGLIGSWMTERASGFSDNDIRSLIRIQRRLAVACKITIRTEIARNVLDTYLGRISGQRVLEGRIRRGDGEMIHAVVWYSDLRDSTALADRMPAEEFLETLNDYFGCTAGAVLREGGEVLRFPGDAVLAIFPIDGAGNSRPRACAAALAAAREAQRRLVEVNRQREAKGRPMLAFGLGLHLGDVMYGNIGVPERLEFSVIGPTANEAARIEALTKELGQPVLASAAFAACRPEGWISLGRYPLRGVGEPIEIFAPAPELSAGAG